MPYVRPEEVRSPKGRVGEILEVIHDPGEDRMSVARIVWDDEEVIATRWNGNAKQPLGNPVSRGHATWFVVDGYAATSIEQAARLAAESSPNGLVAQYRAMASDSEREGEAEEWTEALIADGSISNGSISDISTGQRSTGQRSTSQKSTNKRSTSTEAMDDASSKS